MNTKTVRGVVLAGAALLAFAPSLQAAERRDRVAHEEDQPSAAQLVEGARPGDLHQLLILWGRTLDARSGGDLQQRFAALSEEQVKVIYDAFVEAGSLSKFVDGMQHFVRAAQREGGSGPALQLQPSGGQPHVLPGLPAPGGVHPLMLNVPLATPDYPSGSSYNVYVATLLSEGILSDTNGDGQTNDESCNTDQLAAFKITFEAADVAQKVVELGCDADEEPISRGICFAADIATYAAVKVADVTIRQCEFQGGEVDGALIKATYENSRALHDDISQSNTEVKNLISTDTTLIQTQITNEQTAIQSQITNLQSQVAADVTALQSLISTDDAAIQSQIASVQAALQNQIAAQGAQLAAAIEQNRQQLVHVVALEDAIIKLLLTPEGQRAINPSVVSCTGDNCPNVLNCTSFPCGH